MTHESLHEKAISRAKTFHRSEADLIDVLQEVDEKKTFLHYQCTSLFDYCLKYLKLSPANTSNFIAIARKAKEVPELKEAIRRQEITVSSARKITPVLTQENSIQWLTHAKTLPKPQLEKEVAKVVPQTLTRETAKYVCEDRLEVKLGLSEKSLKNLRRAQDLLSQKSRKHASMEETLGELLEFYLQRNDPVEKAKRLMKPADADASVPGTRKLSAQTKHQINARDEGQCTHMDGGKRCENKRWLETHHQMPLAVGGDNSLENLTTLCWSHHRMQHAH